jgi:hypothetical protein
MDLKLKLAYTVSEIKSCNDEQLVDSIVYRTLCDLIDEDVSGTQLRSFMRSLMIELTRMVFNPNGTINHERFRQLTDFMIKMDKMFNEEMYLFHLN